MIVTIDSEHRRPDHPYPGLTDIFICEFVRKADPLRLMLDGLPVHDGMFELLHNCLVDSIALTV